MERDVSGRLICRIDAILEHLDWGCDDDLGGVVFVVNAAIFATQNDNTVKTRRSSYVRDDAAGYKIVLELARLQLSANKVAENRRRSVLGTETNIMENQYQTYPYVESTQTDSGGV